MAAPLIVPMVDEGLGNSSYLVDLGDGRALAVDAPRDLRAVRAAARRHRLAVAFAAIGRFCGGGVRPNISEVDAW